MLGVTAEWVLAELRRRGVAGRNGRLVPNQTVSKRHRNSIRLSSPRPHPSPSRDPRNPIPILYRTTGGTGLSLAAKRFVKTGTMRSNVQHLKCKIRLFASTSCCRVRCADLAASEFRTRDGPHGGPYNTWVGSQRYFNEIRLLPFLLPCLPSRRRRSALRGGRRNQTSGWACRGHIRGGIRS